MRKRCLSRKGIAVTLSAAMVITGAGVIPYASETAKADDIAVPQSILDLDFESTGSESGTYKEDGKEFSLVGGDQITADPDDAGNKVLKSGTAGYLESKAGIFSDKRFTDGFSINMKVRFEAQASDWNYVFSLGKTEPWNYVDGTTGLIARIGDPYQACFPNDGWQPGNTVNSD